MSDFESDENYEDTQDFRSEINAYQRAGLVNQYNLSGDRTLMTPLERFRINVDGISRYLKDVVKNSLSEQDIDTMLEKADIVEAVEYKNPTGYIMGYLAVDRKQNNRLTKYRYDYVIDNIISFVEDSSVKEPDIVRYARLWENML